MASDQTIAPHTLLPAGAPSQSERIASTMIVKGFTSANPRSTSGMDCTGTNAEEMNVSGNTAMKATEFAASGVDVSIPAAPSQPLGPVGRPTGVVYNPTSDFVISENGRSAPAEFLFDVQYV